MIIAQRIEDVSKATAVARNQQELPILKIRLAIHRLPSAPRISRPLIFLPHNRRGLQPVDVLLHRRDQTRIFCFPIYLQQRARIKIGRRCNGRVKTFVSLRRRWILQPCSPRTAKVAHLPKHPIHRRIARLAILRIQLAHRVQKPHQRRRPVDVRIKSRSLLSLRRSQLNRQDYQTNNR
jgi:hypothetical protein